MIGLLLLQDFHGSDACIVLGLLIMTNSVIPANLCITVLLLMPAVVAGISDEPRLRVCVKINPKCLKLKKAKIAKLGT